jgi:hypothetical protein
MIYRRIFWKKLKCNQIENFLMLSKGVLLKTFVCATAFSYHSQGFMNIENAPMLFLI